jgi:hypothetical protein
MGGDWRNPLCWRLAQVVVSGLPRGERWEWDKRKVEGDGGLVDDEKNVCLRNYHKNWKDISNDGFCK